MRKNKAITYTRKWAMEIVFLRAIKTKPAITSRAFTWSRAGLSLPAYG
jgi:hypothetical protein